MLRYWGRRAAKYAAIEPTGFDVEPVLVPPSLRIVEAPREDVAPGIGTAAVVRSPTRPKPFLGFVRAKEPDRPFVPDVELTVSDLLGPAFGPPKFSWSSDPPEPRQPRAAPVLEPLFPGLTNKRHPTAPTSGARRYDPEDFARAKRHNLDIEQAAWNQRMGLTPAADTAPSSSSSPASLPPPRATPARTPSSVRPLRADIFVSPLRDPAVCNCCLGVGRLKDGRCDDVPWKFTVTDVVRCSLCGRCSHIGVTRVAGRPKTFGWTSAQAP